MNLVNSFKGFLSYYWDQPEKQCFKGFQTNEVLIPMSLSVIFNF